MSLLLLLLLRRLLLWLWLLALIQVLHDWQRRVAGSMLAGAVFLIVQMIVNAHGYRVEALLPRLMSLQRSIEERREERRVAAERRQWRRGIVQEGAEIRGGRRRIGGQLLLAARELFTFEDTHLCARSVSVLQLTKLSSLIRS